MAPVVSTGKSVKESKGRPTTVKKPAKESGLGAKNSVKKTKKTKRSGDTYKTYVYKVLKEVNPDLGISSNGMSVLNSFLNDIFESLAGEASKLALRTNRDTLAHREIQSAVRLVLPGQLSRHAIYEGQKAVIRFAG